MTPATSMTPRTEGPVPIEDYGLIGDTRTAALVAPSGSIEWMCLPTFDSPPLFGRLVGGHEAGAFSVTPGEPAVLRGHRYLSDTVTLETTWAVDGGELTLTDTMVAEVTGQFLPATVLVRRVCALGRPIDVDVHWTPRFGYERLAASRSGYRGGAVVCERGDLAVALTSDGPVAEPERLNSWTVDPSRPVTLTLTAARRGPLLIVPPAVGMAAALGDEKGWRSWVRDLEVPQEYRDQVVRSLLTLRLLTYSPSGAPVAAPSTSLPEAIGGQRNCDYRYSWPRDASIGIETFLAAGRPGEAYGFLAWLRHAGRLERPWLPVLLAPDGRRGPPERVLPKWPGYAGSPPVRIGNAAADQHQLDGYGWVVDAVWALTRRGHRVDSESWRSMAAFADEVTRSWHRPDAGIWERRDDPEHYVHSKLMGWVALDRAIRMVEMHRTRAARHRRWVAARDALAAEIRSRGFDLSRGTYTARYGSPDLDAALLVLPALEFEPPHSPRVVGTIDAIRRELSAGGPLLFRYPPDRDRLLGREGAFLPCSFWLVSALARTGRADEAQRLLDEILALGAPLGLWAEEMDPTTGDQLGNFPQALTHAALAQACRAVAESPRREPVGRRQGVRAPA